MGETITNIILASWQMLLDASLYIILGIIVGGALKMFLSTDYVLKHLGKGRFSSVIKASLLGIPIPLCSCGVLPAATMLKKQGANNGATTSFLISTPESGVDSISITYALLDPIMTVARPLVAFLTAFVAGITENIFNWQASKTQLEKINIENNNTEQNLSFTKKIKKGLGYAIFDVWADIASWFFVGILLAGIITTLLPSEMIEKYLSGGLSSMLIMLVIGIPMYICATASTPVAAAFIMKGVSPGTALVFLLVGPATNVTSMSVLFGLLGKKATAIYLGSIAIVSVSCGLLLDLIYVHFGISIISNISKTEAMSTGIINYVATAFIIIISIKPLLTSMKKRYNKTFKKESKKSCCSMKK